MIKNNFLFALILLFGVCAAIVLILFIKKLFFRFVLKKQLYIFRTDSIKSITNIAMIIATAVGILLILSILTSGLLGILFRAYPGWRAVIQNILIKLGGLFFGPIIGMFVGGTTDLLCVFMTGGVFHYGFFLCSVFYGALSGLVHLVFFSSKKRLLLTNTIFTCLISLMYVGSIYFLLTRSHLDAGYSLTILNINIHLTSWAMCLVVGATYAIILLICWIVTIVYYRKSFYSMRYRIFYDPHFSIYNSAIRKKLSDGENTQQAANDHLKWLTKNANRWLRFKKIMKTSDYDLHDNPHSRTLSCLVLILLCILLCDGCASTFLLPVFDFKINPSIVFPSWIALRELTLPFIIVINVIVLFPTYRLLSGIIKYN